MINEDNEEEIINPENMVIDYPLPISIRGTEVILNQMRYSVGKIQIKNELGSCFFCNINFENQNSSVLMTANHILNESNIEELKTILLNDKIISLDIKKSKIYFNKQYDITIIEIKKRTIKGENKNKIEYLELDNIFNESPEIFYKNTSIYIPQYPKGQDIAVSYGIINGIKNMNILHKCCTDKGSSGSPILNLLNNKLIGLHKGGGKNCNFGSFLKIPIQEYFSKFEKEKENEISLVVEVNKDLNEKIYFLGETSGSENKKVNNLEELEDKNVELYINEKRYEFKKYFTPDKKGKNYIKIKFKKALKDCSYMFHRCYYITKIDLSKFNSKNIKKVENMFEHCYNLREVNLENFDTKNVCDMTRMFYDCEKLERINVSKFNTGNVLSMNSMFACCLSLLELDLSSFDTQNVYDMKDFFLCCKKLKKINLSSFNTEKVENIGGMFLECDELKEFDLRSFNINRSTLVYSEMFSNYKKIRHVVITKGQFNSCVLTILKKYKNIKIFEINNY